MSGEEIMVMIVWLTCGFSLGVTYCNAMTMRAVEKKLLDRIKDHL